MAMCAEAFWRNRPKGLELELVVLFDHRSKIWKKKYQIERNKKYNKTQCDDCK